MSNTVPHPKTKKKTTSTLVQYKDAYLVQYKDGVDIVDPVTGKNRWSKTMRAAKWNLSVWRRLCQEFSTQSKEPLPAVG